MILLRPLCWLTSHDPRPFYSWFYTPRSARPLPSTYCKRCGETGV